MRKIILTALNTLMLVSIAAVAFAADGGVSGGFGLAFIESLVIYALLVALILLFVKM